MLVTNSRTEEMVVVRVCVCRAQAKEHAQKPRLQRASCPPTEALTCTPNGSQHRIHERPHGHGCQERPRNALACTSYMQAAGCEPY